MLRKLGVLGKNLNLLNQLNHLNLQTVSHSDAGLARPDNQDCILVDGERKVFCVADGMGGAKDGALASQIVCGAIRNCQLPDEFEPRVEAVDAAIGVANNGIFNFAADHDAKNMGSTVAVLVFNQDNSQVAIGHAGDTRVYRRRNAKLERKTEDHRKSQYSHFLTKAIGTSPSVEVEWSIASVQAGDLWLICCDGVHDMLPDSTIGGILAKGGTLEELRDRIADAVRRNGALDNFSYILIRI